MNDPVFTTVLSKLRSWRSEVILQDLGDPEKQQDGLQLKLELDEAISWLELCQKYDIHPSSKVLVLPVPLTVTPSSEYRLIEDNETDDREKWIEAKVNGQFIRPLPGSLIVENSYRRRTTAT
ncbi:hypothetical protein KIH39_18045 [Telmatocola sphagniphila]|uniref:Uncharacterized protein n=1 Tax=Telmatocola sphagniphila TaxID=1123043 RepID=A0A8E6ETZ6_9BACT|nr:hypothetical protein [Telmatocola sphagniphila]QVL30745.1 hypothetical protein KIH39_18045 [Telmatocola sphagniphila]